MKQNITDIETKIQGLKNKKKFLEQKQATLLLKSVSEHLEDKFSIELATLIVQESWTKASSEQKEKWLKAAELVEELVTRAPPHLEPHRAQLRQWAQDRTIRMAIV